MVHAVTRLRDGRCLCAGCILMDFVTFQVDLWKTNGNLRAMQQLEAEYERTGNLQLTRDTDPCMVVCVLLRWVQHMPSPMLSPQLGIELMGVSSDLVQFNTMLRGGTSADTRALLWCFIKHWRACILSPATRTDVNALATRVAEAMFLGNAQSTHIELVKYFLLSYDAQAREVTREEALIKLFAKIDTDGDCELGVEELKSVFGQYHKQFLRSCDKDNDVQISQLEWVEGAIASSVCSVSMSRILMRGRAAKVRR